MKVFTLISMCETFKLHVVKGITSHLAYADRLCGGKSEGIENFDPSNF